MVTGKGSCNVNEQMYRLAYTTLSERVIQKLNDQLSEAVKDQKYIDTVEEERSP